VAINFNDTIISAINLMIKNDAVVLGILLVILSFIFQTSRSENKFWKKFYKYVPTLLLCYFLPSLLNTFGIVSGKESKLYFITSRYLLPASLVLLTISIDLREILKLGSKSLIMFFTGTIGIIFGGPIALFFLLFFSPDLLVINGSDSVWRGFTTVAGSWIGGGANQAAMKEIFNVSDDLFSSMVAIDVVVANIWMAFLLYGAGMCKKIDKWTGANTGSIKNLKEKMENYQLKITRLPNLSDTLFVMAVAFGISGLAHFLGDIIAPFISRNAPYLSRFNLTSSFFWLIIITTTISIILSFTPMREIEGVGASRYGSLFLYLLVATIGIKMDVLAIFDNPILFLAAFFWIIFHAALLIIVAYIIKAPFFFLAVGSQANIGGAASAPIVASAFHKSLAPVGVLLAVMGYAVGTYGAWFCGVMMNAISP
tara:strand:+ start:12557 stop:13834 length:1278 start_codon:yes stop_codon:yes gene_type:complete